MDFASCGIDKCGQDLSQAFWSYVKLKPSVSSELSTGLLLDYQNWLKFSW
uniref:Uncharacterized protein n=1 Tax=Manihot esculenta TaxID=3983 RepID=A0A2C9WB11_MANES